MIEICPVMVIGYSNIRFAHTIHVKGYTLDFSALYCSMPFCQLQYAQYSHSNEIWCAARNILIFFNITVSKGTTKSQWNIVFVVFVICTFSFWMGNRHLKSSNSSNTVFQCQLKTTVIKI